jgi:hypothetical protein
VHLRFWRADRHQLDPHSRHRGAELCAMLPTMKLELIVALGLAMASVIVLAYFPYQLIG